MEGKGPFSEEELQRMKQALDYKREHITYEKGIKKKLDIELLVALNDIITKGLNKDINAVKFWTPWYCADPKIVKLQTYLKLQSNVDRYNYDFIDEEEFVEAFMELKPFLTGNWKTCKILFV